jgi:hypothetical protein
MGPGKCPFCLGTGKMHWAQTKRTGPFPTQDCGHCGGTGSCRKCIGESVPGWVRVLSLDGLR